MFVTDRHILSPARRLVEIIRKCLQHLPLRQMIVAHTRTQPIEPDQIGLVAVEPGQNPGQSDLDRIYIPGGDSHRRRLASRGARRKGLVIVWFSSPHCKGRAPTLTCAHGRARIEPAPVHRHRRTHRRRQNHVDQTAGGAIQRPLRS